MQKNKKAPSATSVKSVNGTSGTKAASVNIRRSENDRKRRGSAAAAGGSRRIRKPLTEEQRKRKNERDRIRRKARRDELAMRRPKPVIPLMSEPSSDGHVGCRGKNACARCYRRKDCQRLADPTRIPRLHPVTADQAQANEKTRREATRESTRALRDIDCFIYDTLSKMANESRSGSVSRRFELPDGVAEVRVSRNVSGEKPSDVFCRIAAEASGLGSKTQDQSDWFTPSLLGAFMRLARELHGTPRVLCGFDPAVSRECRRGVDQDVSRAVDALEGLPPWVGADAE